MVAAERTYTIPLKREVLKAPRYKRAKKAVSAVREYVIRHSKSSEVKIGKYLNQKLWQNGIRNPPNIIKVDAIKDDKGTIMVELFGAPKEVKKEAPKKKAETPAEKIAEKMEAMKAGKKEEKKEEGKPVADATIKDQKESKEQPKKEEKVVVAATTTTNKDNEDKTTKTEENKTESGDKGKVAATATKTTTNNEPTVNKKEETPKAQPNTKEKTESE